MEQNWADRLADRRDSLSRRELDLVEYITDHPHEAAFLRQRELCDRANVSKPVVISCFRSLGYDDYKDFIEGIQGFYAGQIDSARASTVAFKDVGDVESLVAQAIDVETSTLETFRRHLDPAQVEQLARAILGARTVYFYGEGTGGGPAGYLAQRLRRCGISALVAGVDRPHLPDDLGPLGPGDLVLTFFYTQDKGIVSDLFALAKTRGAGTVLVTGTPDPELYRRADLQIFVPRGRWNFKNSMAVPMAFAHIVLLAVEFLGGLEVQNRLNVLETTRKGFASPKDKEDL